MLKSPKMSNFWTFFENRLWAPHMLSWIRLKWYYKLATFCWGALWQKFLSKFLPPAPWDTQFSFVAPIFFIFWYNHQFSATKTTFVVFKQHDPQSVADWSGVAGDPLLAPGALQTEKHIVFLGFAVENGSPSTIWGVECCRDFYFLNQQQKLPNFCKKHFFLSPLTKKLSSSRIFYKNCQ